MKVSSQLGIHWFVFTWQPLSISTWHQLNFPTWHILEFYSASKGNLETSTKSSSFDLASFLMQISSLQYFFVLWDWYKIYLCISAPYTFLVLNWMKCDHLTSWVKWPLHWMCLIHLFFSMSSLFCLDVFHIDFFFTLVDFYLGCLSLCWAIPADMSSL